MPIANNSVAQAPNLKVEVQKNRALEIHEAYEKEPQQKGFLERGKDMISNGFQSMMNDYEKKDWGSLAVKSLFVVGGVWLGSSLLGGIFNKFKGVANWFGEKVKGVAEGTTEKILKTLLVGALGVGAAGAVSTLIQSVRGKIPFTEMVEVFQKDGISGIGKLLVDKAIDLPKEILEKLGITQAVKEKAQELKDSVENSALGKKAMELLKDPLLAKTLGGVADFMRKTAHSLEGDALTQFKKFFPDFEGQISFETLKKYSGYNLLISLLEMGVGEEDLKNWAKKGGDAMYLGLAGFLGIKFVTGGTIARCGIVAFLIYGLYKEYPKAFAPIKQVNELKEGITQDILDSYTDDPEMQDILRDMNLLSPEWYKRFQEHCNKKGYNIVLQEGKMVIIGMGDVISWTTINIAKGFGDALLNLPKLAFDDKYSSWDYFSDYYQDGAGVFCVIGASTGFLRGLLNRSALSSMIKGGVKGFLLPVLVGGKISWKIIQMGTAALTKGEMPHTTLKREMWGQYQHVWNSGERIVYQARAKFSKNNAPYYKELTSISKEISELSSLLVTVNNAHFMKDFDEVIKKKEMNPDHFKNKADRMDLIKEIEGKIKGLQEKRINLQMHQTRVDVEAAKNNKTPEADAAKPANAEAHEPAHTPEAHEASHAPEAHVEAPKKGIIGKRGLAGAAIGIAGVLGLHKVVEIMQGKEESIDIIQMAKEQVEKPKLVGQELEKEALPQQKMTFEQLHTELQKVNNEYSPLFNLFQPEILQNTQEEQIIGMVDGFLPTHEATIKKVKEFLSNNRAIIVDFYKNHPDQQNKSIEINQFMSVRFDVKEQGPVLQYSDSAELKSAVYETVDFMRDNMDDLLAGKKPSVWKQVGDAGKYMTPVLGSSIDTKNAYNAWKRGDTATAAWSSTWATVGWVSDGLLAVPVLGWAAGGLLRGTRAVAEVGRGLLKGVTTARKFALIEKAEQNIGAITKGMMGSDLARMFISAPRGHYYAL